VNPVFEQLRLADFDYELPQDLIAQTPSPVRDRSRLLVLDRRSGDIRHRVFSDVIDLLQPGDVLVLNDTRVFSCRLFGKKAGGGKAELFLLEEIGVNRWRALVRGGVDPGKRVVVTSGVEAEVIERTRDGVTTLQFHGIPDVRAVLDEIGRTPLPPYIKREAVERDRERYQTVYAAREGAVAAPTAGLHLTEALLASLRAKGVETVMVTLHVGPGTFQPVRSELIAEHRMHPERFAVPAGSADAVNRARSEGRRVIAVGTTSVRTLETAAAGDGRVHPGEGVSTLFIYPGYRFRVVDGMITNFHLPKSTLLMLVTAFAGLDHALAAYRLAVRERYRFYSYGDAMFIG
jgi:S-adenosylmethionine:tRNA ribosyltransferase-isomerase